MASRLHLWSTPITRRTPRSSISISTASNTLSATYDTVGAYTIAMNGKPLHIPDELNSGYAVLDLAYVWIDVGACLPSTDISKFYSGGHPVALGTNGETPDRHVADLLLHRR